MNINYKGIEQDKIRRAYEEKLAAEEKLRLQEEESEIESWRIQLKGTSVLSEKKNKEKEDWSKYLSCNPKPDPNYENELTTYLSQYKEETKLDDLTIKNILDGCQYTEDVYLNFLKNIMIAFDKIDYHRYYRYHDESY